MFNKNMNFKLILILIIQLAVYTVALNIKPANEPPKIDKPDDRIINGFTPGQFDNPHVALLTIQLNQAGGGRTVSCTGSLISAGWIVTAGHCAENALEVRVQLGLFDRNVGPAQTIVVSGTNNIILHPNFVNNGPLGPANDIALLRLIPNANIFLQSISPIPMACPLAGNFAGRPGQTCGWGITSSTATDITNILQCVNMPVITNTECQQTWGTAIRQTNVCTANINSRTACHGDSGGPLTVIDGIFRTRKLIGATSFGSADCTGNAPNVFTRIPSFNAWILLRTGVGCSLLF